MTGHRIVALAETDSTNEEMKRRIDAGEAEEGLVIVAAQQSAGRGRHGRSWASPQGNLYLSLLLKAPAATLLPQLSFVAALAVADSIDALCGNECAQLKWPNDVLVNDSKIAGILIETVGKWVIIGIGVNIESAPQDMPYPATSLAALGARDPSVEVTRDTVLRNFSQRHNLYTQAGFSAVRAAWLKRAWRINQAIAVRDNDCVIEGTFAGLDENGFCLLETHEGSRRIASGSLAYRNA